MRLGPKPRGQDSMLKNLLHHSWQTRCAIISGFGQKVVKRGTVRFVKIEYSAFANHGMQIVGDRSPMLLLDQVQNPAGVNVRVAAKPFRKRRGGRRVCHVEQLKLHVRKASAGGLLGQRECRLRYIRAHHGRNVGQATRFFAHSRTQSPPLAVLYLRVARTAAANVPSSARRRLFHCPTLPDHLLQHSLLTPNSCPIDLGSHSKSDQSGDRRQ
mmetsp:Transcript_9876/g.16395  ORF Transcript_9876/g.16395 Transcript_9876/m.16395 type:complete len:213 (+) Transcript_9876:283-921(+)